MMCVKLKLKTNQLPSLMFVTNLLPQVMWPRQQRSANFNRALFANTDYCLNPQGERVVSSVSVVQPDWELHDPRPVWPQRIQCPGGSLDGLGSGEYANGMASPSCMANQASSHYLTLVRTSRVICLLDKPAQLVKLASVGSQFSCWSKSSPSIRKLWISGSLGRYLLFFIYCVYLLMPRLQMCPSDAK